MSISLKNTIVTQGCLTLSGLKPASLFNIPTGNILKSLMDINQFKTAVKDRGLSLFWIEGHKNRMIIFLYRSSHIYNLLKNPHITGCLSDLGYPENPESCLCELKKGSCQEMNTHMK